jgi:hypothetical protein
MTGGTPVSLIVHTIGNARQQVAWGSSVFRDVMAEGVSGYPQHLPANP